MTDTTVRHALVLAGGRSQRMGTDKAALSVDGETQLARTVALAAEHVPNVFVSVRADQRSDAVRSEYAQIVDRYPNQGPLAGILSALEFHQDASWLVLACDLPRLDSATIAHLLRRVDPQAVATAFAAEDSGLPEPLCAVWTPAAIGPCHEAMAHGTACPRKILLQNQAKLLELPVPGALDNANTPEDLARIVATVGH